MPALWMRRVWKIGVVLLAVTLAASGLAIVLSAAGDFTGRQTFWGVADVTGIAFLIDLGVFAVCAKRNLSVSQQESIPRG